VAPSDYVNDTADEQAAELITPPPQRVNAAYTEEVGSIQTVVHHLGLFMQQPVPGLALVFYHSAFAKQQAMAALPPAHKLTLPNEVHPHFKTALAQVPPGVCLHVEGFFVSADTDAMHRQFVALNFYREIWAEFPINQIWWMPITYYQQAVYAMPDLISWFVPKLPLFALPMPPAEANVPGPSTLQPAATTTPLTADQQAEADRLAYRLNRATQAVAHAEKTYGPNHPNTATRLHNLAELYYGAGRYTEAESLDARALAIYEAQLGKDHPTVATSLNNLAELYRATGRYEQAEPLHERALAIREVQLGKDHPDTATSLNNLALLYQATSRYTEAEPLLIRALAIDEAILGYNHPDTAISLNNLGMLYLSTGRYAEAEPLCEKALTIYETQLGPTHPNTAIGLNNLASVYKHTGRYAQAEPLYKRALTIREVYSDPNHPDIATSLNSLAMLYQTMRRYAEAEPLFKRALMINEFCFEPEHPNTCISLNNLAGLYDDTGRYAEAELLYERAVGILLKCGLNHPNIKLVTKNLLSCYVANQRTKEEIDTRMAALFAQHGHSWPQWQADNLTT
jgi:tetratricopeptide (TPR) repeat protein